MKLQKLSLQTLALFAVSAEAQNQSETFTSPYAPVYAECPSKLAVRPASDGLSSEEKSWRDSRSKQVIPALKTYLDLVSIKDLDVKKFVDKLNSSSAPIIGLSVSGGGTQSGLGGLGVWQAFDSRNEASKKARTGGLTQLLSYITGLSGGGGLTVSTIASNNFTSVDEIRKAVNFSIPYDSGPTGNYTIYFEGIFESAAAKAELGFTINVADIFGQFWATYLPPSWKYSNYSDIAQPDTAFTLGDAPMPIICLAEVVPGQSPEIGKLMFPGNNATNGFNLTSYEVTPFEFGSWAGGRVQAFMPTKWLGTSMDKGSPQNSSECVEGFDKFTFIQGTTVDAFTAWFIDSFYGIPTFAKRALHNLLPRQASGNSSTVEDIPIPSNQEDNPLVELVQEIAENFNQTFNASLWATYPNPFEDYNDDMKGVSELLLCDGSLAGETNPIRPLIIPDRKVDFVIVYEASSDAAYSWVNGTNLINTALHAHQGNIPFPEIPDVNTMVNLQLNRQPSFFGCNASDDTPLVLYLPNAPWTSYTNYSYTVTSFTPNQMDLALENAFQVATYGNGTVDEDWPVCLACAAIKGSLRRTGTDMPKQCTDCFTRHCWNGTKSEDEVSDSAFDLPLREDSGVSYETWNSTIWSAALTNGSVNGGSGSGSGSGIGGDKNMGSRMSSNSFLGYGLTFITLVLCLLF